MKINKHERERVFILFVFFAIWVAGIGFVLVKTQVFNYEKYLKKIEFQRNRILALHPKRGTIYDRNGEVLAISIKAKSAFFSNKEPNETLQVFQKVKKSIKLTHWERKNIRKRILNKEKFVWIKRKLSDSEYQRFLKIKNLSKNKSFINFLTEYKRIYPQNNLASHILGGVGVDEQGLSGIEYGLESAIKGKGGEVKVELDARKRIFKLDYLTQPVSGKDVYLTIDASIQFFAENQLRKAIKKYKAKGGVVIVMDSNDGSILAMVSYPYYKPDHFNQTSLKTLKNKAVAFLYEPGSTFKIILAASALENESCHPQQMFNCYQGSFKYNGVTISDHKPFGHLTFEDIIVYSSNIGVARIALRLGESHYYDTIQSFQLGRKTGIGLPSEERGIIHPLSKWNSISVTSVAKGYEVLVTPIQMTQAFNVVASGGYLIQPNLIREIQNLKAGGMKRKRILSPDSNQKLVSIMSDVVTEGTGKKARLEGIEIAGKTGTALKFRRGAYQKIYVSSFGGFFPARNPEVTVFVVIDEPTPLYYGGDVAAPVFRSIAEKVLMYLNIFPELDRGNEITI